MDERDVTILKAIADLETGSPERLHEETGIPVSTIHYRLNNLRDAGVIENDLYDVDLDALGLGVTVVLDVFTDYSGTHHDVGEKLAEIEGVTQVYFTMGETDFMVTAHLSGREMVERLITDFERIDEVERTNSTFVVETVADAHSALQSYSLDTLVAELTDGGAQADADDDS
ncbi:Lrp/AsnC family transcriptional regulator [Halobaculum sp. P14]|uniref:Lrp/AsnC family transcriptional regulator n=1 Tax=Halobaculum sp. P14 TaxID=3421638 RepID=UPI003EBB2DA3